MSTEYTLRVTAEGTIAAAHVLAVLAEAQAELPVGVSSSSLEVDHDTGDFFRTVGGEERHL